jgi:hypothetical protein
MSRVPPDVFRVWHRNRPEPHQNPIIHGDAITPRLQRLLDALAYSPAIVRTATWDVVAWNRAAAAVLTDYGSLPPEQRNVLRMIFCDPRVRAAQFDWESVARYVVGAFSLLVLLVDPSAVVLTVAAELTVGSGGTHRRARITSADSSRGYRTGTGHSWYSHNRRNPNRWSPVSGGG